MTNQERIVSILKYRDYDRMPVEHFGFWPELVDKWYAEGHLSDEEYRMGPVGDGTPGQEVLNRKLGFDCNYHNAFFLNTNIHPAFEPEVVEVLPDGTRKVRNSFGVILLEKDGAGSIPAEVDHLLKGRAEWEEHAKPRLQFSPERVVDSWVNCDGVMKRFRDGGLEHLRNVDRDDNFMLFSGSLYGRIRDYVGIENLCYMLADDEELFTEIIDTNAELCYKCVEYALERGAKFQIAHFWEDIAFKNGPLVNPRIFAEKVGPHYKRITDLLKKHGIDLVSLDCDGKIDALIPTWIENGVNVMFPIEVGTWDASILPWRERYGREIRGVGGMNKTVFGKGRAAVDAEIERLKHLVELGGFIPCPDHRIPIDAEWDNVRYYCDKFREAFTP